MPGCAPTCPATASRPNTPSPPPATTSSRATRHSARPPRPLAICGDSAGGCLALQLAQHIRDTGLPAPKALGLIGPIADLSRDPVQSHDAAPDEMLIPPEWADRIRDVFLPGLDPADPAISPLFGDLTGLPPTLIHASAEEALAHDARRLAEAMDASRSTSGPACPMSGTSMQAAPLPPTGRWRRWPPSSRARAMKRFAALFSALDQTNSTKAKTAALAAYFATPPRPTASGASRSCRAAARAG
jgi:hypothetical protein